MNQVLDSLDPEIRAELHQQSFHDLVHRCWPGVLIYPAVWLIIVIPAMVANPDLQNLLWCMGSSILMLALALLRRHLMWMFQQRLQRGPVEQEWELSLGLALSAGFWGLVAASALMPTPFNPLQTITIASTACLTAGGIISLAISARMVFLFLGCMLLPTILVISLGYSDQSLPLAGVLTVFWGGMYWVTSLPRNEYYEAHIANLKLERQAAYLNELSQVDGLTGLKNRRCFDEILANEVSRASRNGYPLSFLLVDLDHFKRVNDEHGHLAGDQCLKAVAAVLQNQLRRSSDLAARFGGEEFALILPGTPQSDANEMAEQIRLTVAAMNVQHANREIRLTASVGGCTRQSPQPLSPESMIEQADLALYRAKAGGRNQVQFAEAEDITSDSVAQSH